MGRSVTSVTKTDDKNPVISFMIIPSSIERHNHDYETAEITRRYVPLRELLIFFICFLQWQIKAHAVR